MTSQESRISSAGQDDEPSLHRDPIGADAIDQLDLRLQNSLTRLANRSSAAYRRNGAVTRSGLTLSAKPGARDDLMALLERLEFVVAAEAQPGCLGAALFVSLDDPGRVIVEESWLSPDYLERWRSNPLRDELIAQVVDLLDSDPQLSILQHLDRSTDYAFVNDWSMA